LSQSDRFRKTLQGEKPFKTLYGPGLLLVLRGEVILELAVNARDKGLAETSAPEKDVSMVGEQRPGINGRTLIT
jgi:hypothetical protein